MIKDKSDFLLNHSLIVADGFSLTALNKITIPILYCLSAESASLAQIYILSYIYNNLVSLIRLTVMEHKVKSQLTVTQHL